MGGRLLTRAVQQLSQTSSAGPVKFNQIILAAPDIDRDTFMGLAQAVKLTAERVTLYASSRDRALNASKRIHGYPALETQGQT